MKKNTYVMPNCRFRQLDLEQLMAASGTVTVNMNETDTYNGSFSAKEYTPRSVWDDESGDDGFE